MRVCRIIITNKLAWEQCLDREEGRFAPPGKIALLSKILFDDDQRLCYPML